MVDYLNHFVEKIQENIPGFISVSLVNTNDGTILAYKAKNNEDNSPASSFQIEIFKDAIRSFENTEGLTDKRVKDVSIIYKNQVHVTSISDNKQLLVHLVLDNTANLVLAKMIMIRFREELTIKLEQENFF